MPRKLYKKSDEHRVVKLPSTEGFDSEPYRTPWRRDYGRLIHSPAFRRLQGKTQLFPYNESDFFRNRLTHSLEVAQVAKSIAIRVNATHQRFDKQKINTDIVETAALAHDLGHPPFGHNGEIALDECMKDVGGFEGNAQTLRILSKLEKRQVLQPLSEGPQLTDDDGRDCRVGLNLTYRTLAAILKYDNEIPRESKNRKKSEIQKGYYYTERQLVKDIKKNVIGTNKKKFKTVECWIMDIADDIAYSTYDLEDAFKAGFLTPLKMISASEGLLEKIAETVRDRLEKFYSDFSKSDRYISAQSCRDILIHTFGAIFELSDDEFRRIKEKNIDENLDIRAFVASKSMNTSEEVAENGYFRSHITSQLVGEFIRGIDIKLDDEFLPLTKVRLSIDVFKKVEVLKVFTYQTLIMSSRLKVTEYRGKDIVTKIFEALHTDTGHLLLPEDFQRLYQELSEPDERLRVICDFIAGMTDRYAVEFYQRLYSTDAESIWKPI